MDFPHHKEDDTQMNRLNQSENQSWKFESICLIFPFCIGPSKFGGTNWRENFIELILLGKNQLLK